MRVGKEVSQKLIKKCSTKKKKDETIFEINEQKKLSTTP